MEAKSSLGGEAEDGARDTWLKEERKKSQSQTGEEEQSEVREAGEPWKAGRARKRAWVTW